MSNECKDLNLHTAFIPASVSLVSPRSTPKSLPGAMQALSTFAFQTANLKAGTSPSLPSSRSSKFSASNSPIPIHPTLAPSLFQDESMSIGNIAEFLSACASAGIWEMTMTTVASVNLGIGVSRSEVHCFFLLPTLVPICFLQQSVGHDHQSLPAAASGGFIVILRHEFRDDLGEFGEERPSRFSAITFLPALRRAVCSSPPSRRSCQWRAPRRGLDRKSTRLN